MSLPERVCALLLLIIFTISCTAEEIPEMNEDPSCPTPSTPENYSQTASKTVLFSWKEALDPEGEEITYHLQIATDAGFTDIIFSDALYSSVQEVTLPDEGFYFWRVRARDASNNTSTFSQRQNFCVAESGTSHFAPFPPELRYPLLDEAVDHQKVKLGWTGHDLDNIHLSYDLYLGTDYGYQSHIAGHLNTEEFTINVEPSKVYYWKVKVTDPDGNISVSPVWWFKSL